MRGHGCVAMNHECRRGWEVLAHFFDVNLCRKQIVGVHEPRTHLLVHESDISRRIARSRSQHCHFGGQSLHPFRTGADPLWRSVPAESYDFHNIFDANFALHRNFASQLLRLII